MNALISLSESKLVMVARSKFFVDDKFYQWVQCGPEVKTTTHIWDGKEIISDPSYTPPDWFVLKSTIRRRMGEKAGVLNTLGEWWLDAPAIRNTNAEMISVITEAGCDPADVLKPDPDAVSFFGRTV